MHHLIRSRLTQAAAHLATSNRTVHEIAKLCGYQSDAALAKAFKREYHLTPGEYRATAARRPIIDII
jgi:AraC family transcriptional activator of mtrCDE